MGDRYRTMTGDRDARAFRCMFAAFYPKVKAMLMRQCDGRATAEKIAQDTMLAVWSNLHVDFEERGSASARIYATARDLRIDRVSKQAVWHWSCGVCESERSPTSADKLKAGERDRSEIKRALDGLAPEQLQVIQLSFVDALSLGEIAARLVLSPNAVKSRMRLALEQLRLASECET